MKKKKRKKKKQQQPMYCCDRIDCLINHDIRQSHPSAGLYTAPQAKVCNLINMIYET